MRVVLTIAGLSPEFGGPSRSVPALADALANEEVDVDLIACAPRRNESASVLPASPRVRTQLLPNRARRYQWRPPGNDLFGAIVQLAASDTVIHDNGLWLPTNHAVAVAGQVLRRPL